MEEELSESRQATESAKSELKEVQAELKAIPSTTDLHLKVERLENNNQRAKEDISLLRSRLKKAWKLKVKSSTKVLNLTKPPLRVTPWVILSKILRALP